MRSSLIFLISLLSAVTSICQPADNGIKEKADYAAVQNKLYKVANSSGNFETKQTATFALLHDFVQQYPAAENSLVLLADAVNLTGDQINTLISLLDSSMSGSGYMSNVIVTKKRISVAETGKPFPEVALKDTAGNMTPVRSFFGKIILIDLWASWCSPCRGQIPDLRKTYKKFNAAGFEIIGVSMDDDKNNWLNAIAKDKQTWPQFCEMAKFRQNSTARFFHVYGIPANFLINEKGILVGQDLSPEQVAQYLESRE